MVRILAGILLERKFSESTHNNDIFKVAAKLYVLSLSCIFNKGVYCFMHRPIFLNLWQIRLPWPALASITHRIAGAFMALFIPLIIALLFYSLESEDSFNHLMSTLQKGLLLRVFVTLYISALIYHTYAGIRHLLMDIGFFGTNEQACLSAKVVFVLSILKTIFFIGWFWGVI
jgi:succinate dehydrogenase / fumarate reductase cytochrome b subunit